MNIIQSLKSLISSAEIEDVVPKSVTVDATSVVSTAPTATAPASSSSIELDFEKLKYIFNVDRFVVQSDGSLRGVSVYGEVDIPGIVCKFFEE